MKLQEFVYISDPVRYGYKCPKCGNVQYSMIKEENNQMDYEKKYKETIAWIDIIMPTLTKEQQEDALENFPELTENEDERIRKDIMVLVKDWWDRVNKDSISTKEQMIAWLEKQGEQKKSYDTCNSSMMNNKKSPIGEKRDFGYFEEKSADKVEPKFHEGDWVITDKNDRVQIKEVNNSYYTIDNGMYFNIPYVDRCWHLWTVQDAIAGDVLSNGDMILIFKEFEEPAYRQHIIAYIGLDSCGHIQVTVEHWELGIDKAKPATKEQCDTLMKAIKDAGYEWDIEKKELKKLTQSVTKISEQDTWSEEDEKYSQRLENAYTYQFGRDSGITNWLKSLKNRMTWKPSKKQMETLEYYMHTLLATEHKEVLFGLYNDLKKL